jgi:hypothetical protein
MVLCNQCGSSSRDSAGRCRGCGAPLSSGEFIAPDGSPGTAQSGISAGKPALYLPSFELIKPTSKSVWIAALLTLFFGPLGMLYSTVAGALVMFAVYVFLRLFVGGLLVWAVWPVCIFWAAMAARD